VSASPHPPHHEPELGDDWRDTTEFSNPTEERSAPAQLPWARAYLPEPVDQRRLL